MAFPTSPSDGDLYDMYKYNAAAGAWNKRIISNIPDTGDSDMGQEYTIGDDNRNPGTIWAQSNPVTSTTYTSPDLSSRFPLGAKAVVFRFWVQKSATLGGDWWWAGFSSGSSILLADGATIARGNEHTYISTYHHHTVTVPLIDGDTTVKCFWSCTGTYSSFNANVIGYHI